MDFDDAIKDHLELRRRNARLEQTLPLGRYRGEAMRGQALPFDRRAAGLLEETQEYAPAWLAGPESETDAESEWGWEDGQEQR
jgi:hypothetical protein